MYKMFLKLMCIFTTIFVIFGCESFQSNEEIVDSASQELSQSATRVFTISDMYLSNSGWGVNGAVYYDASNRCISGANDASVGIVQFSGLPSCPNVVTAQLNFATTEWTTVPNFEIHRLLRPITPPSSNFAGAATASMVGWRYSTDSANPWTLLGAKGIGTDISLESVIGSVGSGGNIQHSVDVLSLVSTCLPTGSCNLTITSIPASGQSPPAAHFWLITGSPTLVFTCDTGVPVICGDGEKTGNETCDDGNSVSGDGCSEVCVIETGFACSGTPSVCSSTCGDNVKASTEQCDDGNVISGDGCSATCLTEVCSCTCSVP